MTDPRKPPVTLDSELVAYWEREASRFERLAAAASWGWVRRGYLRKADRARARAEPSRRREAQRQAAGPEGVSRG